MNHEEWDEVKKLFNTTNEWWAVERGSTNPEDQTFKLNGKTYSFDVEQVTRNVNFERWLSRLP